MVRSGGAGAGDEERLCLAEEVAERGGFGRRVSRDDDGPVGKAMESAVDSCKDGAVESALVAATKADADAKAEVDAESVADAVEVVCEVVMVGIASESGAGSV